MWDATVAQTPGNRSWNAARARVSKGEASRRVIGRTQGVWTSSADFFSVDFDAWPVRTCVDPSRIYLCEAWWQHTSKGTVCCCTSQPPATVCKMYCVTQPRPHWTLYRRPVYFCILAINTVQGTPHCWFASTMTYHRAHCCGAAARAGLVLIWHRQLTLWSCTMSTLIRAQTDKQRTAFTGSARRRLLSYTSSWPRALSMKGFMGLPKRNQHWKQRWRWAV